MDVTPGRRLGALPHPEALLRFSRPPAGTRFYAGVDRHARAPFLAVLDQDGHERYARNPPPGPRRSGARARRPATTWPSAARACTAGTGSPTPAAADGPPSPSATPGP